MEQIKAINDAMSFLAMVASTPAPTRKVYKELVNKHLNQLKDAGVDNNICEHFSAITWNIRSFVTK